MKMKRTKEEIEFELEVERDRYRRALEDASNHDNRIYGLRKELKEVERLWLGK